METALDQTKGGEELTFFLKGPHKYSVRITNVVVREVQFSQRLADD